MSKNAKVMIIGSCYQCKNAGSDEAHGELGKTYLDVLSEFTTGGCGLDDWEWGALPCISSNDDIQFKKNRIRSCASKQL